MRSVYIEKDINDLETIKIEDEKFHHLKNVIRIKNNEEILVLNGSGIKYFGKVNSLEKKHIEIAILKKEKVTPYKAPDVGVALTKRESFEACLKVAVENGVKNFYSLQTEYSQNYEMKKTRLNKVLENAYEQSNNPFKMNIVFVKSFENLKPEAYDEITLYESKHISQSSPLKKEARNKMILIGPEGGFSETELEALNKLSNLNVINLQRPILRTPTALSFALGQHYLF